MNLRRQLLIVAALSLVLPWAGCEYVREIELALRDAQQAALLDDARLFADLLSAEVPPTVTSRTGPGQVIYAESLTGVPLIDGYADEWGQGQWVQLPGELAGARYRAATDYRFVYLAIAVDRDERDASGSATALPESVLLLTGNGTSQSRYRFAAAAPGPLAPDRTDRAGRPVDKERRIQGNWQIGESGSTLEIRLSLELAGAALGFRVRDQDGQSAGTLGPRGETGQLIMPSPAIAAALSRLARPGISITVADRSRWVVAKADGLPVRTERASVEDPGQILPALVRTLLRDTRAPSRPRSDHAQQITGSHIDNALTGEEGRALFADPDEETAIIAVAVPVGEQSDGAGIMELTQTTRAVLTLTNAALTRLLGLTGIAVITTVVVLLGYASWLSFRVRRLSRVASGLLDEQGHLESSLPGTRSSDEIGALSRSFSTLLSRVAEYNDYLRALASRLSHELRTPLAIVDGSLENLAEAESADERQRYIDRARAGSARLGSILRSMSEATRTEQAIEQAIVASIDLDAFVADYAASYRAARPDLEIGIDVSGVAGPVRAAPELLAQLLDKLVDNAADFHSTGTPIRIAALSDGDSFTIEVVNTGPTLPSEMHGQLTGSLVSLREADADGTAAHMGLGLYIARLIAEFHRGSLRLSDLSDGTGVVAKAQMKGLDGEHDPA